MAGESSIVESTGPRGSTGITVVISASPINRIILTHSIERLARRAVCIAGWEALSTLDLQRLVLAVVDLTDTCMPPDRLLAPLLDLRNNRDDGFPRVLGVTRDTPFDGPVKAALSIDAMISMPLTQDKIHAAINRLLQRERLH